MVNGLTFKKKFEKEVRSTLKETPKKRDISELLVGKQTKAKLQFEKETPKKILEVKDLFFN